jgi:hypothetical protein
LNNRLPFPKSARFVPIRLRRVVRGTQGCEPPLCPDGLMAPTFPETPAPLPRVRLELRQGSGRPTVHEVADAAFLIGGVPG